MITTLRSARPRIRSVCLMGERGDYQTCSIASARACLRASSGSSGVSSWLGVGRDDEDMVRVGGSEEITMVSGIGASSDSRSACEGAVSGEAEECEGAVEPLAGGGARGAVACGGRGAEPWYPSSAVPLKEEVERGDLG